MNIIKKFSVTLAIVTALCPIFIPAQKFIQGQIDAIVAKVIDKAPVERQAKMGVTVTEETDVISGPQSTVQSPDMTIPFGVRFSDYARYGTHFQNGDQKYIGADGSYNGASAIGHLGNEDNNGEFQLSKASKSDNGAIWGISIMVDHWSDEANLKKTYAGVTNALESNPSAYIWAGHDSHWRSQQGIDDYFWMSHDGRDAGAKNFDTGGIQSGVTTVAAVKSCSPKMMGGEANPSRAACTDGSGTGDKGNYAVTLKIHNIKVGPLGLEIYVNYSFDSEAVEGDGHLRAWQGAFALSHTSDNDVNEVIVRYSNNSDNSVYNEIGDLTMVYASFEGSHKFIHQARMEYLLAFHDYDNSTDESDNRKSYGAIVCPMYFWSDVHPTWLEAGYQRVNYDNGGDNHSWKLTLPQNMSIAMGSKFRPMLRFYVIGSKMNNGRIARINGMQGKTLDNFNLGAV